MPDIEQIIVQEILKPATELKNKYTNEPKAAAAWVCIFSQTEKEYKELCAKAEQLGKIIEQTPTGPKFLLNEPIADTVKILKIRQPDPTRTERGDADFTALNYDALKKELADKENFKIIPKTDFEMIELMEAGALVRVYFSNPPIEEQYKNIFKKFN